MSRNQVTNARVWASAADVYSQLLRAADRINLDARDPALLLAAHTIRTELRQAHREAIRRAHLREATS